MGQEQGCHHLKANPGFGVFWYILQLLAVAYLQPTSFIEKIFSGLSWVVMALFQIRSSALDWPQRGVRVWKLSSKYPDEKPSSLSLPTQGCCFSTLKPTRHLLAMPNIIVEMGALYEGLMTRSAPLTKSYGDIFPKKTKYC